MPIFTIIDQLKLPDILTEHPSDTDAEPSGIIYNLSNDIYFKMVFFKW